MKKKPWYQSLLKNKIPWVIAGITAVGSITDTIKDLGIISPLITYLGTILIIFMIFFGGQYLRNNPILWVSEDDQYVYVKSLNFGAWLFAFGIIIALWIPRFIRIDQEPPQIQSSSTSSPAPSNNNSPTNTIGPNITPTQDISTLQPTSNIAPLLTELQDNPIIPGIGLAGVAIGDSKEFVLSLIGNPLGNFNYHSDTDDPNCCMYATWVSNQYSTELGLTIYFNIQTETVTSFHLSTQNNPPNSPYVGFTNNITLGSTEDELLHWWGIPRLSFESTGGCPGPKPSIYYSYEGIGFRMCKDNRQIHTFEIPGIQ